MKPLIAFVSWNRMGFTIQNLELLLSTSEDFDLYIVDNGSRDDTRDYLNSLSDPRIKEVKILNSNFGLIYGLNYCLSKRLKNQPFLNMDADVSIRTPNFIKNCEEIVKKFPEVGLIGNVRPTYFQERNASYDEIVRDGTKFWKSKFILGCMMYFPSETIESLGYFNEENHMADLDIDYRLDVLGKWKGYCPDNLVTYSQPKCSTCDDNGFCKNKDMTDKTIPCFIRYTRNYGHREFADTNMQKFHQSKSRYTKDNVYCATIHDLESSKRVPYDGGAALDNFEFFKSRT